MILINDPIFCDPLNDKILPVVELVGNEQIKLDEEHFYLVGGLVYKYIGNSSISSVEPGSICKMGERYYIEPHLSENVEFYDQKFIISKRDYDSRVNCSNNLEDMVKLYTSNYNRENNLIKSGNIKIVPSGEIYMPDLDPDDDPFERVTKLMLRHMKLVLNDFRGQFSKKHGLDNIKSALNGATKNMSIIKFISWCDTLGLDWEIVFDNISPDVMLPLPKPVVINSKKSYPWVDIPPETKTCFTVPLDINEDPLKRGIKLVLYYKGIDLKDYRHRSPTPHLLNNMKSAIKSKQKMTLPYCMNWSEILDIILSIKLTNPKDGIWYKMTGYNMSTNDTEIC